MLLTNRVKALIVPGDLCAAFALESRMAEFQRTGITIYS